MSKTTVIVGGIVVVVAILVGGILYSRQQKANIPTESATAPSTQTADNTNPVVPAATVVPVAGVPNVITSATVYSTDTTAIVNGSVNPKGAFTSYWFEYGLTSLLGTKISNQTIGSGFTTISAPGYIIGLKNNSTYFFRLVAENQYGKIAGNTLTFSTSSGNTIPIGSIPAVKTLVASNITRTTANINGEVNPNKNETGYWFEYGKTKELGNASVIFSTGNGSTSMPISMPLQGLDPTTTYYFRLDAQNQFGTVNGSILDFQTAGPAAASAPSVVTSSATGVTSTNAILHGTINPNLADTEYWFVYGTDSHLNGGAILTTPSVTLGASGAGISSVSQTITSLNPNTTYYFLLMARNSVGSVQGVIKTFKTRRTN